MNSPYTYEELSALKNKLDTEIKEYEQEAQARGLPPLAEQEARELIIGFLNTATERLLTKEECFLAGQLLGQYKMAVTALTLGKEGRYFVVSQADFERLLHAD